MSQTAEERGAAWLCVDCDAPLARRPVAGMNHHPLVCTQCNWIGNGYEEHERGLVTALRKTLQCEAWTLSMVLRLVRGHTAEKGGEMREAVVGYREDHRQGARQMLDGMGFDGDNDCGCHLCAVADKAISRATGEACDERR